VNRGDVFPPFVFSRTARMPSQRWGSATGPLMTSTLTTLSAYSSSNAVASWPAVVSSTKRSPTVRASISQPP
jgi:hypothetical protein